MRRNKMRYDNVLQRLGGFGVYQKIIICLVSIPVCFESIPTMMLVFIVGDHDHRCRVPEISNDNFSKASIFTDALTNVTTYSSQCFLTINNTQTTCSDWVYDKSTYTSTLISKFNMVCKDKFMRSHILFSHFMGTFVSVIVCGFACDRWGRRPLLIFGIILLIVPNIIRPWMENVFLVALCEFLNACGSAFAYVVPFTIVTELVGPSHRVLASFSIYISYCMGEYVLLLYAYLIRDWEILVIVISVPITACFFILLGVPESPRWLMSKGRTIEAMGIFQKTAKYNKTIVDFESKDIDIKEDKRMSIIQGIQTIMKSKPLNAQFLILFFNWFAISFIYYGISMNTGDLGGNVYINYTISTTVETAAILMCFFADRFPRKKVFCPAMIFGSVACLSTTFTSIYGGESLHWLTVMLAMVGKLGVTVCFFVVYVITSEISPTFIRGSMLGLCSTGARIGSMTSSYIGKLGVLIDSKFGTALPLIIFGSIEAAAGLFSLLLPETRNTKLPETIEEAIHIESCYLEASSDSECSEMRDLKRNCYKSNN